MNNLEKLEEATMRALQGKLKESFNYNNYNGIATYAGYGTLRHICSSSDQYFEVEPELVCDEKVNRYLWFEVNWEELDMNKDYTENDVVHVTITPSVDEGKNGNTQPIQYPEQKDFTDYNMTMDDVEYFNKKGRDIEKLFEIVGRSFYEEHNNGKEFRGKIETTFTPYN